MSEEEARRVELMKRVSDGKLKLRAAADLLRRRCRQVKRIWRRYREEGWRGLMHRNARKRSNRIKPREFREKVLGLVREKYSGEEGERFGPTLAARAPGERRRAEGGPITIAASRSRPPMPTTTIGRHRASGNWTAFSAWNRNGSSATTGWCATRAAICNWSGRAAMHRSVRG